MPTFKSLRTLMDFDIELVLVRRGDREVFVSFEEGKELWDSY